MAVPQQKPCTSPGCTGTAIARGRCKRCYVRDWRKDALPERDPAPATCPQRLYILATQETALRKLSRVTGKSYSQMAREALAQYLEGFVPPR